MEPDRLPARLRRVVEAAESLDDRLLVLLFVRKAESAPDLAELAGAGRAETMTALGRLSHAKLVAHNRPEGEPIHWFATPNGRTRGEQLHRAISLRLPPEAAPSVPDAGAQQSTDEPVGAPRRELKTRRRVPIDQNEKTGFSWD